WLSHSFAIQCNICPVAILYIHISSFYPVNFKSLHFKKVSMKSIQININIHIIRKDSLCITEDNGCAESLYSSPSSRVVSFLIFFISSLSSIKDSPNEGIISFIFGVHSSIYCGKLFSSTSRATEQEVEAPGDSPSSAMTVWSSELTASVPNWMNPLPYSFLFLITCP